VKTSRALEVVGDTPAASVLLADSPGFPRAIPRRALGPPRTPSLLPLRLRPQALGYFVDSRGADATPPGTGHGRPGPVRRASIVPPGVLVWALSLLGNEDHSHRPRRAWGQASASMSRRRKTMTPWARRKGGANRGHGSATETRYQPGTACHQWSALRLSSQPGIQA